MELRLTIDINADNPVRGDLHLENGQLSFCTGVTAAVQDLHTRLNFSRGEWFLDAREGFPWFEDVLRKNPNIPAIRALVRKAILQSPYIQDVEKLDLRYDRADRSLRIEFLAVSTSSAIIQSQDVGPIIISLN